MGIIDIDRLRAEVSPDAPCGEDLEYEPAFAELERSVQGKPEQQMGDNFVPAEAPDWGDVQRKALELLSRTKDLRVLVYLTRALTHTSGFLGFADGVTLLHGSLEQYWEPIHPQLDPEDDHDPTLRVNILASLCDPATMLRSMREAPLVSSRAMGRFSLRDMAIASGELAAPADSATAPPEMSTIKATFMECALEELQATAHAINDAIEHVIAIEAYVTDQVGAANAPNLSQLVDILKEAQNTIGEWLTRRGVSDTASGTDDRAPQTGAGLEAAEGSAPPATMALSGQIASREEVIRALNKICEYYSRYEPSSPVPMLVERAKRLVSMNFAEIIKELAPDGVSQVEVIRGPIGEAS